MLGSVTEPNGGITMAGDLLNRIVFLRVRVTAAGVATDQLMGSSDEVQRAFLESEDPNRIGRAITDGFLYHWLRDPSGVIAGVEADVDIVDIPSEDADLLRRNPLVSADFPIAIRFDADRSLESEAHTDCMSMMFREGDAVVLLVADYDATDRLAGEGVSSR